MLESGQPDTAYDALCGIGVALALIPEAIAFSIIAEVDPQSRPLRLLLHRHGHRLCRRPPGMISAATGAMVVMIMVVIGTFSWESIRNLRKNPKSSSLVMTATVVVVVATHNLALGVMVGVLISSLVFAYKIGRILYVGSSLSEDGLTRQYQRPRTPGDISRWRRRASFND